MIHLSVISSRLPCTFEHQFGVGYPAVLRHRMHNNEPLAFPCWFSHPRPIVIPVPDKIIAMVFIHIGLIQIHFRTHDIVAFTIPPFFTEVPVASCYHMVFFLQVLWRASAAYRFFLHQPSWTALRVSHDSFHGCEPHS